MTKWQTIKLVLLSAAGGAIVWWIVLGAALGWMSPGSAERKANEQVEAAMLEALAPICVVNFQQDAEREAKLEELKNLSTWQRDDFVMEQGWATMPGAEQPESRIAQECLDRILASG